jgi:CDGSH-type Zn-finger protein
VLPYCDGSHMGSGVEPMMITFHETEDVAWCTCGRSKSFPRCDGSHDKE